MTTTRIHPQITQLQFKFASLNILQRQPVLNIEVRVTVRIDDAEVTGFERCESYNEFYRSSKQSLRTCVIDFNIKQHHVAELNRVYRHNPPRAKVAPPVLICVFVVYSVLQVVRQQIFQLYWRHEDKIYLRIPPKVGGDEQKS